MKVALLISGGVDSAVACYQLVSHGIIPDLWYIKIGADEDETLTCTAEEDIEMASAVAYKFGLKLNIIDLHKEYWDNVVGYTMDHVKRGLTPNPDVMCNQFIKFGAFIDKVGNKYDRIATGHYATIYRGDNPDTAIMETLDNYNELSGKIWLGAAADKVKDQTDFLCTLNDYQMTKIMLPIGHLTKSEVRDIANEQHLAPAKRKDSQGICFLGKINYNDYIERYLGKKEGNIRNYDSNGEIIGKHNGYWFHTIGQRKGLQLSGGPWYVVAKDIENNDVYVTRNQLKLVTKVVSLNSQSERWFNNCVCDKLNNQYAWPEDVQIRIRHTSQPVKATLWVQNHNVVCNTDYLQGVAPGQFAVIYNWNGKIVLGSAEISI